MLLCNHVYLKKTWYNISIKFIFLTMIDCSFEYSENNIKDNRFFTQKMLKFCKF